MPLGRVMILGIPLVLGFGFLAAGTHTYVEQTDAIEAAEPVEVEVLDTEIERERRSSDSGSRYKYTPVVEYRYEIDGETYTSDTGLSRRYLAERVVAVRRRGRNIRLRSGRDSSRIRSPRQPGGVLPHRYVAA